jgi:PAS domain S-box-containing protein
VSGETGPEAAVLAGLGEVEDPVALLAKIFAHAPVPFQLYRADGRSLLTNAAFRALFGSEPPAGYNVLRDELAAASGVLEHIRRAFAGEVVQVPPIWYDPRELEQVEVTDGRRVAVEATFFPLRGRGGAIDHVAVVFKDLTVERTLREETERERDLLGLIIEQSGDGIIVADAAGTLRVFNKEAERQHGVPLAVIAAPRWAEVYGLRTLDGGVLPLQETPLYRALHGEVVERARWVVARPDGSRRVLSGTAAPLRTGDGAPAGAVLVTRDETDQLEDDRRLRFQATVLRNIRDSVIVTGLDGRILEWNQGATAVFGYQAEEMLGQTPSILYPDREPTQLAADLATILAGREHVGEWLGRRKDGSQVWLDVKTTLMRDDAGEPLGFLGIGKDVTDRKRAEEARARADHEREEALALAESASRAKDEFLAMLGHELRNPLSPIVSALQLMRLKGEVRPTREHEIIERQVQHLVRLVDDLLDVTRITRGKVELERAPVELEAAVSKAVEMASPLIEQRRHRLTVSVPPAGLRLDADAGRLAQVISNLLTNAARYTEPGGTIEVAARCEGDEIVLRVIDDGIGIEPELLSQVFDLFVQGRQTLARADGGLGIGLTLVRNLVQLHGGTVAVRSGGRGRGSEFVVRLPALLDASPGAPPPPRRGRRPGAAGRRIVVVDDNVDAAELMAQVLIAAGHEVRVAHDGPATLGLIERFRPEVALLDLGLPVMDGYELAVRLRRSLGSMAPRLIAVTGYGQEHDHARSREAGFDDHLVKPVDADRLLERIDRLASPA